MKIEMSYYVKFANGTSAWLAVGKPIPEDAIETQERPMIIPDDGMALRNVDTGEISSGHWLRDGDSADKWEEIEETEIESIDAQKND